MSEAILFRSFERNMAHNWELAVFFRCFEKRYINSWKLSVFFRCFEKNLSHRWKRSVLESMNSYFSGNTARLWMPKPDIDQSSQLQELQNANTSIKRQVYIQRPVYRGGMLCDGGPEGHAEGVQDLVRHWSVWLHSVCRFWTCVQEYVSCQF